jgi:hypothetical protein
VLAQAVVAIRLSTAADVECGTVAADGTGSEGHTLPLALGTKGGGNGSSEAAPRCATVGGPLPLVSVAGRVTFLDVEATRIAPDVV